MPRRLPILTLALAALCAGAFGLVVVPAGVILWRSAFEPLPADALRALRLVHQQVVAEHVEPHDPEQLLTAAIDGMVESLGDRYSEFVPAADVPQFERRELEGSYVGIGVLLFGGHAPITVQAPLVGGPAERAGIRPGDRILGVDGEDVAGVDPGAAFRTAARLLRGEPGSTVELKVGRASDEVVDVVVARAEVERPLVRWVHHIDPAERLGYVYVAGFQHGVADEFDAAVAWLQAASGGPLRGLVLDLRDDPGGPLDEAIELANRFLPEGEIVTLKRRDPLRDERHLARPELCTLPDLPVVVLINGGTASASEVVTGALQDHGRATVVGSRSYGKGVVQSIYTWSGLDFRLKLTTAHYYTPAGRCIEGHMRRDGDGDAEGGLLPDVVVDVDDAVRQTISGRLGQNEVPLPYRDAARRVADAIGRELIEPLTPGEDPQLGAAVEALRGLAAAAEDGR